MAKLSPFDELKLAKRRLIESEKTLETTRKQIAAYAKDLENWASHTRALALKGGVSQKYWDKLFIQQARLVKAQETMLHLESIAEKNVKLAKEWVLKASKNLRS